MCAAGLLAGCGDDDAGSADAGSTTVAASSGGDSPTIASSSRSKAEFVRLANAICETGRDELGEELGAYLKRHRGEGTPQSEVLARGIQAVFLPRMQTYIDEIRNLGAPAGDRAQVEEILAALQQAVDAGNEGPVTSQAQFSSDFRRSGALARSYGLNACAYG